MSLELGNLLSDLDGILHIKKAEAAQLAGGQGGGAVEKGNVVDGSATATQGAGYSPPRADQGKDGDGQGLDQGVSPTQKSDPDRSVKYNKDQPSNKGQANETATVTGGNQNADSEVEGDYHENPLKAAAQANRLLAGLEALLGRGKAASAPAPRRAAQPSRAKAAGQKTAEQLISSLVNSAMRKSAMDASEIAAKWDSMTAEEKAACEAEFPEEVAKAKEMMKKDEGGAETEKMSAVERRTYELYKLAGQQNAFQLLQQLQNQGNPQQVAHQKQAEYEYALSHQAGEQAAERAWAEHQQMAKQAQHAQVAQTQSGYVHPAHQPSPAEAYNQMLKYAALAGINPDPLHGMLSEMHRQAALAGGPPHPFVDRGHINKQSVDIGPIRRILSGLLDEQVISQEEADAIRNRVGAAENLDERTLMSLVQGIENPQAVLERLLAGDVQELQRNTHYAPSPSPAMPATQPTIPADLAERERAVSQGGATQSIPGSTEALPPGMDAASSMIIQASCKKLLRQLDPVKYGRL